MDGPRLTLAVLKRARWVLLEYDWCQGDFGYDVWGRPAFGIDHGAVTFCSVGAIYQAANDLFPDPNVTSIAAEVGRGFLSSVLQDEAIAQWNDHRDRKKEQVIAAFDAAIEKLEAQVGEECDADRGGDYRSGGSAKHRAGHGVVCSCL